MRGMGIMRKDNRMCGSRDEEVRMSESRKLTGLMYPISGRDVILWLQHSAMKWNMI
jgi:hypothetical protein